MFGSILLKHLKIATEKVHLELIHGCQTAGVFRHRRIRENFNPICRIREILNWFSPDLQVSQLEYVIPTSEYEIPIFEYGLPISG